MLTYFFRRSLQAGIVLIAVSILTFFLSTLAPGDIVLSGLALDGVHGVFRQSSFSVQQREYRRAAERLGRDRPVFYFSIRAAALPDTLHQILRKEERQNFRRWAFRYGQWETIDAYRQNVYALIGHLERYHSEPGNAWVTQVLTHAQFLLITTDRDRLAYLHTQMQSSIPAEDSEAGTLMDTILDRYGALKEGVPLSGFLPALHWHGFGNQYHRWIGNLLKGDMGRSQIDGRPVSARIGEAIGWTLRLNGIAILLAFTISLVLGVLMARYVDSRADRIVSSVLFVLFAIPSFWLAMLCVVFLTTPEYGAWTNLFPTGGVGTIPAGASFWEYLSIRSSHMTLPVFCLMSGTLAYLTRQMRGGMLRELRQDYIKLARAKGITEGRVHWHHALRNALFPMITLVGAAIPAAISGSVIIEVIFSIPGMGRLLFYSILASDWPVVYAMVLLAAMLTIIGYFISDILYYKADPRVKLSDSVVVHGPA